MAINPFSALDCNFDQGNLCKWTNNGYAQLKWESTQANNNGWQSWAKTDHTTNSGNGIILKYSNANILIQTHESLIDIHLYLQYKSQVKHFLLK